MGSIPQLSVVRGPSSHLAELASPSSSTNSAIRTIDELWSSTCRQYTAQVAVRDLSSGLDKIKQFTYEQLEKDANRIARAILQQAKEQPSNNDGDFLVAVSLEPGYDLIVTLLAILKCRAAYLPLDPSFPEDRLQHILTEAQPVLVVADRESATVLNLAKRGVTIAQLLKKSAILDENPLKNNECFLEEEALIAIVLYTSGSTGIPKGVRIPHRAVMNRLRWQWQEFPYSETEKVCAFKTALTFVDSVSEIWGPLLNGLVLLIIPRLITKDPQQLAKILDNEKVERLVLVPSLLRSLLFFLELEGSNLLRDLRLWVCSGEPLSARLVKQFFEQFPHHILSNFYGSTEVMGDVTFHKMTSSNKEDNVPIGIPLSNTAIYLLDDRLQPVPMGQTGELYVSGLNLSEGYVNGRDRERFIPNPLAVDPDFSRLYRTGDFARLHKGVLMYEGRTDAQVKVRGHRVDLAEVERALISMPEIEKAVALCYMPGELEQALLGFVILKKEYNSTTAVELEAILQSKLASYMLPQVIIMDSIPLLVNGKNDRQYLLKYYRDDIGGGIPLDRNWCLDSVPEDKREAAKTLLDIVADTLGASARTKLELSKSFYQLGGNSLNSVYTVTKLRQAGWHIGMSEFLQAKDLAEVVSFMRVIDGKNNFQDPEDESSIEYPEQMLSDQHRQTVTRMIINSFYEKADLEQWLIPEIVPNDYQELMDQLWRPLVEKGFSLVVVDSEDKNKLLGIALNFDIHDEPEVIVNSKLNIIFDFLEHLEGPLRESRLPKGKGQVLHSFMMATEQTLSSQQNVQVIQALEQHCLLLAKKKGFSGIFTTNTSPLTQQLSLDVLGYEALLDYQVNRYVSEDGSKPFEKAPDSQKSICCWKRVRN